MMKDDDTDPVFAEALHWFARMQDEKASAEDRQHFSAWLAADPAHKPAYCRAEKLWARFDILKPEFETMRHRSDAISRRSALLGGVAVLVAGASGYLATRPGVMADYKTGARERQAFTLPDGSTIELDSYSAVSTHFTDVERRLVLHRGQAFFTVAPDVSRRFIVEAGNGTVQALGTRFDVKLMDPGTTVTVVEHSVLVVSPDTTPIKVEEGWQVSYGLDGIATPRRIDVETVQAWRRGRIVFEDVPLLRVLKELERYRRGRIVLMDDRIGNIPVTAIFETSGTDEALRVIAETLPVKVVDAAGFVTFVYNR